MSTATPSSVSHEASDTPEPVPEPTQPWQLGENTICLLHLKPVSGGFILESQIGGRHDIPGQQAVIAGRNLSGNLKAKSVRAARRMIRDWLDQYFDRAMEEAEASDD